MSSGDEEAGGTTLRIVSVRPNMRQCSIRTEPLATEKRVLAIHWDFVPKLTKKAHDLHNYGPHFHTNRSTGRRD